MTRDIRYPSLLLLCQFVAACSSAAAPPMLGAAPEHQPTVAGLNAGGEAGPPFAIAVDVPAEVMVGAEAVARISVVLRPTWHINLDFPTVLRVEGPADAPVASPEQRVVDARRFDRDHAEFDIVFVATAVGQKAFRGELEFAVCREESCLPVRAPVVFEATALAANGPP